MGGGISREMASIPPHPLRLNEAEKLHLEFSLFAFMELGGRGYAY